MQTKTVQKNKTGQNERTIEQDAVYMHWVFTAIYWI